MDQLDPSAGERTTSLPRPVVVVASRYGTVTALDTSNGKQLWRRVCGPGLVGLVHTGDTVFASVNIPFPAGQGHSKF
jgi:hypothetical protein